MSREMTAAEMESLLRRVRVRDFRATFTLESGTGLRFEVTLPAGEMRQEMGRVIEDPAFIGKQDSIFSIGRAVLRMDLFPDESHDPAKRAVVRWLPPEEVPDGEQPD